MSTLNYNFFFFWYEQLNSTHCKIITKKEKEKKIMYIILQKLFFSRTCDEITTISFSFFFRVVYEINIQKVNCVYMFCGDNFIGFQNKMSKVTKSFSFVEKVTKFNHGDLKEEL